MSSSTEDIWPSSPIVVEARVKHLITRLFEISDSTDPTSGRQFAEELFTTDGTFKTHETCVFTGHDAIAACRKGIHPEIVSRSHKLIKVWASDSPATDLSVLGVMKLNLVDGNNVEFDFNARFVVENDRDGEDRRLSFVQVWTDPTKSKAAIGKAKESLA